MELFALGNWEWDASLLLNKYSNATEWNKTELDKNNFNV